MMDPREHGWLETGAGLRLCTLVKHGEERESTGEWTCAMEYTVRQEAHVWTQEMVQVGS